VTPTFVPLGRRIMDAQRGFGRVSLRMGEAPLKTPFDKEGQVNSKHEILTTIYKAFNRREIDVVLAAMHPDVDWPNGMEGGRVLGRQSVREYWTRQWAMIDPRVEPVHFAEDEDGRIVVGVHQVAHDLSGKLLLDHIVQHIYTFENGVIIRMDIR
jgi:ketosteroid isomerase-like protein